MLEFDKEINNYISHRNGMYMRYSDDFIIVLPKENEYQFKEQFEDINNIVKSIPNLELQPDKTQIVEYNEKTLNNCNELVLEGVKNGKSQLDYLGFTFDGNIVTIRDKTLSKYYYRMYRKLKTIQKSHGITKNGNIISYKNVYEKYSIKGANTGKGNFISYVQRAEDIFGKNEAINRGTKNHMQKIRRKIDAVK